MISDIFSELDMIKKCFYVYYLVLINFENNSMFLVGFLGALGKVKATNYPEKGYPQTTHKVVRFL